MRESSTPAPQADDAAAALAHCRNLIAAKRSPLVLVAAALPLPRQNIFYPAYAAMRIIDDFVDDDFLARPKDRRDRDRPAAKHRASQWRLRTEAASLGREVDLPSDQHDLIYEAVRLTLGAGTLGPAPWLALAGAMQHDLSERTLMSWADFDEYAEGAAVAPATIFIYILACRIGPGHTSSMPQDLPARDHARDLAKYCYLVHILRDLREDARLDPQLLTIPEHVFQDCRLAKCDIATAPDHDILPLADILWARAAEHRIVAEVQIGRLIPSLGPTESRALAGLIRLYDEQHTKNAALYRNAP